MEDHLSAMAQSSTSEPAFKTLDPVEGPNNTTIRIISVMPPSASQKENLDPNSTSLSARQRSQKKKTEEGKKPAQSKGINLKVTKKPLQLSSASNKGVSIKSKEASFPITLKAIEEFFAHSQNKENEFQQLLAGKGADVVMGDSHLETMANATTAASSAMDSATLSRAIS
ncbi:unnamed protein product [Linum trigynum]|uniref:Uncharacterized protein n=1 Tax=Linum trigynum TaxID=586398 RepID=A0AAV2CDK8_9ROSI